MLPELQDVSFLQISYHGSGEGGESDDSEGENQELAQIDRGTSSVQITSML